MSSDVRVETLNEARATSRSTRRVVAAGTIGTVIEYFDFLVYATVSGLVFGELFFPGNDPFIGSLLAISTFAVGYLVRPLGGVIFGHFGDRYGRRRVLFITLMMMGVSTVCIGLLPTYATIGVAAPVMLVVIRVIQGLGVGGEYGAAAVMIVEHANDSGRRGFYGSFVTVGAGGGFFVASGVLAILTAVISPEQFLLWGWRVPFLMSAVLLGVGFYIRFKTTESPLMEQPTNRATPVKVPFLEVMRTSPRQVFIALVAPVGMLVAYYVVLVFSVPFAVQQTGDSSSSLLSVLTASQFIYMFALLTSAWLSDRIGRLVPMIVGSIGLLVWGFAFFPLLLSGSDMGVFVAFLGALIFISGIGGPLASFLAELFATNTRLTGLSLGYQVSTALAGGLTPVIAMLLVQVSGSWWPVAAMITVGSALSLLALFASRKSVRTDLRD
jgi:MFS family permease